MINKLTIAMSLLTLTSEQARELTRSTNKAMLLYLISTTTTTQDILQVRERGINFNTDGEM